MTKQEADLPFPECFEAEAKRKSIEADAKAAEARLDNWNKRLAVIKEDVQGMSIKIKLLHS